MFLASNKYWFNIVSFSGFFCVEELFPQCKVNMTLEKCLNDYHRTVGNVSYHS